MRASEVMEIMCTVLIILACMRANKLDYDTELLHPRNNTYLEFQRKTREHTLCGDFSEVLCTWEEKKEAQERFQRYSRLRIRR